MVINNLVRVICMFLCISSTASSNPTLKIASVEGFKVKKLGMFSTNYSEALLCAFVEGEAPTQLHNRPQTVYEFIQVCNRNYNSHDYNSGWKKYLATKPTKTNLRCFNILAVDVVYSAFKELGVHEEYNISICLSLYAFMLKIDQYAIASRGEQDALKVWFLKELLKYSCSHFIADSEERLYQHFYYIVEEALLSRVDNSPDDNSPDDNSPDDNSSDDNSSDDNSPVENLFIDGRDYVYNVLTVKFIKPSRRRRGNNRRSRKHQFDYCELMSIYTAFQFFYLHGEYPSINYCGSDEDKAGCLLTILHLDGESRMILSKEAGL